MNTQPMTPELDTESDAVFAYWKREGLYKSVTALCYIANNPASAPELKAFANTRFEDMYCEAIKALNLTSVIPLRIETNVESKPKYVWRNGARVKVQA